MPCVLTNVDTGTTLRSLPSSPATRSAVLAAHTAKPTSATVADVAGVLRVLGDPTRLAIVAMLAREEEPLCVCHVEARFDLAQPTISHHLRVLREAALVTTERRGTWVYYALDRARVESIDGLEALLRSVPPFARRAKACCP